MLYDSLSARELGSGLSPGPDLDDRARSVDGPVVGIELARVSSGDLVMNPADDPDSARGDGVVGNSVGPVTSCEGPVSLRACVE